jgi:hypothetical protein
MGTGAGLAMFSFTNSILSFQTAQEVLEHVDRELLARASAIPEAERGKAGVVADWHRFVTSRPADRSEGTVVWRCGRP